MTLVNRNEPKILSWFLAVQFKFANPSPSGLKGQELVLERSEGTGFKKLGCPQSGMSQIFSKIS
jgi:hypothetical protein